MRLVQLAHPASIRIEHVDGPDGPQTRYLAERSTPTDLSAIDPDDAMAVLAAIGEANGVPRDNEGGSQ